MQGSKTNKPKGMHCIRIGLPGSESVCICDISSNHFLQGSSSVLKQNQQILVPKHRRHSIRKGGGVRRILTPNVWRHRINSCLNRHDYGTYIVYHSMYKALTCFYTIWNQWYRY
jgi:hypothetical protein